MSRYAQLSQIIDQVKPRTIIEVGTWNGERAMEMASAALQHGPLTYYGFDLFEDASDETDKRELNVKAHHPFNEVREKLTRFAAEHPDFAFELGRGDTRDSLVIFGGEIEKLPRPILAFIDGGHSLATIASDYANLRHCDYVVMDDFYAPDQDGQCPDLDLYGCNRLLEDIGKEGADWFVLPMEDPVRDGGVVHMATVGFKPKIKVHKELRVQTKNSIADEAILANIEYSLSRGLTEFRQCKLHERRAVIVSGGPTFKGHLDDIRGTVRDGAYVFCVKTSHDWLIEQGVVPYGCLLLDPRPHVLDFVENPHPDVRYFVASQVHPVTMDRLIERGANITLYHALVGAGEQKLLAGKALVSGGSTSATRGISLLNAMGFCRFTLYGYDSCFPEKPENYEATGPGKQLIEVKVNGRHFWTTAELVAQCQDFEKIAQLATESNAIDLDVIGDGIIPHVWSQMKPDKADFGTIYDG